MERFRLAEAFVSINGEGQRAGELALFLRFTGCNLRCSWCDTQWANAPDASYEAKTAEELVQLAEEAGVHNITLTGGEPLLQSGIRALIAALMQRGFAVEIETNGSVPLPAEMQPRPSFTMDYKLPASGMEQKMCLDNLPLLTEQDTLKFVCAGRGDLERAAEIIAEYRLIGKCKIYFSPVFGQIDPAEIVEFMKERRLNGVRLQLQLHKFIWEPQARGV
ncbi:MAG: putative 7-carboxy-7-deazaguanine synthase QueE [Oscillospiraceae bacterium]|nr:putative 7-carboxy-7-deazaguanine synthase QueE [Oscillospiraceae bacterium]